MQALTNVLPFDSRRNRYTYMGINLFGQIPQPIFTHDDVRSYPSLLVGTTGSGKTEAMLQQAIQDIHKGRPVVWVEGKPAHQTWNKAYCATCIYGPGTFYSLFPTQDLDHLSHSWNPLYSKTLPMNTISEAFFNTYYRSSIGNRSGETYYYDIQRNVFSDLCRALEHSGRGVNFNDIVTILEHDEVMLSRLGTELRPEGRTYINKVLNERSTHAKEFKKAMEGFLNHLRLFSSWTINSTNPDIVLDELLFDSSQVPFIYVALPINSQRTTMSAIGNLVLAHMKAIAAKMQTVPAAQRREISVYVDEADSFIDDGISDAVKRGRDSGVRWHFGMQAVQSLRRVSDTFMSEMMVNTPNIFVFYAQCNETARWFSELSGEEPVISHTATYANSDPTLTEKLGSVKKVHHDAVNQLLPGQCWYRPAARLYRPILLGSAYVPALAQRPEHEWNGYKYHKKAMIKGLNYELLADTLTRKPESPWA